MRENAHTTEVQVRYADTDAMGHVNNATYVTYLELARSTYYDDVIGPFREGVETVVATLEIEYQREIELADRVTVATRATSLGESSLTFEYELYANDDRAAAAETVVVAVDTETGTSRPLPDEWRTSISAYEER